MTGKTCQPGHSENPAGFQEQDFTHFPGLADLRSPPPAPQTPEPGSCIGRILRTGGGRGGGGAPLPTGWLCPNPLPLLISLIPFTEHLLRTLMRIRRSALVLKPHSRGSNPDSHFMTLGTWLYLSEPPFSHL